MSGFDGLRKQKSRFGPSPSVMFGAQVKRSRRVTPKRRDCRMVVVLLDSTPLPRDVFPLFAVPQLSLPDSRHEVHPR
jgi:hypothetical protein